jgi:hypothetical protein
MKGQDTRHITLNGEIYPLAYSLRDIMELRLKWGVGMSGAAASIDIGQDGRFSPESVRALALFVWVGTRANHKLSIENIQTLLADELNARPLPTMRAVRKAIGAALEDGKRELESRA